MASGLFWLPQFRLLFKKCHKSRSKIGMWMQILFCGALVGILYLLRCTIDVYHLPNVRFDYLNVSNVSLTSFMRPMIPSGINITVKWVNNIHRVEEPSSPVNYHRLDLQAIEKNIWSHLQNVPNRTTESFIGPDYEISISKFDGMPQVRISHGPKMIHYSPFQLSNMPSNKITVIGSEPPFYNDGFMFLQRIIAPLLGNSTVSQGNKIPDVLIKLDDMKSRELDGLSEAWIDVVPIIYSALVMAFVIRVLNHVEDEHAKKQHIALRAYGVAPLMNNLTWCMVLLIEVTAVVSGMIFAISVVNRFTVSGIVPKTLDLSKFFVLIVLYAFQCTMFAVFCTTVFRSHPLKMYFAITVLELVYHTMNDSEEVNRCGGGETNLQALIPGPKSLSYGIMFCMKNPPISASKVYLTGCLGRGYVETLNYTVMVQVQLAWALIFSTLSSILSYTCFPNETLRPRTKTSYKFWAFLRKIKPKFQAPFQDYPLIEEFSETTRLALSIKDLICYNMDGQLVFDKFSLMVPSGQIVSLIGDTDEIGEYLIAVLTGAYSNYHAQISSFRKTMNSLSIGICPVDVFLFERLSIRDNVILFLSYRYPKDAITFFSNYMRDLAIIASLDDEFSSASEADQRKIAISIALLAALDVVILEEPTKNLTHDDRRRLSEVLHRDQRHRGILIITSNPHFAETVSDRINLCANGQVVFSGSTKMVTGLLNLTPKIIIYLRLPPDKETTHQEYSLLKVLDLINFFDETVKPVHITRHQIVLDVYGAPSDVEHVYKKLQAKVKVLNIQKIELCEPGIADILKCIQTDCENPHTELVGDFRHITINKIRVWKRGLQTRFNAVLFEGTLFQIIKVAGLAYSICTRRNVLSNMILLPALSFFVSVITNQSPYRYRPLALSHFRKVPFGIYCNNISFHRHKSIRLIKQFKEYPDFQVNPVSKFPDKLGQVCLEIDETNSYIVHAPVSAMRDTFVFLGKFYNSLLLKQYRVTWYWNFNKHYKNILFLGRNYALYFKSTEFEFLIYATFIFGANLVFFVKTQEMVKSVNLQRFGFTKFGCWFGVIAFAVMTNLMWLILFEILVTLWKPKYYVIFTIFEKVFQEIGAVTITVGETTLFTAFVSCLPIKWNKLKYSLFVVIMFVSSVIVFQLENYSLSWNSDRLAEYALFYSVFFPPYHLAFVKRRFTLSQTISSECRDPSVTDFFCPIFPPVVDLCCAATCPTGNHDCTKWSSDLYGAQTGEFWYLKSAIYLVEAIGLTYLNNLASEYIFFYLAGGRKNLVLIYFLATIVFVCSVILKGIGKVKRKNPELEVKKRLQKGRLHGDDFVEKEIHKVDTINSNAWDGLLLRSLYLHDGEKFVLKNINMAVPLGQMIGIFGAKEDELLTLSRAITGLVKIEPESEISINNVKISTSSKNGNLISYSSQIDGLSEILTVEELLVLHLLSRNITGVMENYHVELLVNSFQLEDIRHMAFGFLSKSKKKLVSTALAFIGMPAVILLSDPLEEVDSDDRLRLSRAVNALKSRDVIILILSRNLEDCSVFELDRTAVLADGEFLTLRTLPDLLATDTSYHIIVHLNAPPDERTPQHLQRVKDLVFCLICTKFPDAKLVMHAGLTCEFHIRGEQVTYERIRDTKRVIIETLFQAKEIKIGYVSGKRRLIYLIEDLQRKAL